MFQVHARRVLFTGTSALNSKGLEERIYLSIHTDAEFNFCHKGIHSVEMYAHVFKSISVWKSDAFVLQMRALLN